MSSSGFLARLRRRSARPRPAGAADSGLAGQAPTQVFEPADTPADRPDADGLPAAGLPAHRPLTLGPVFPSARTPVSGSAALPFRPDTVLDGWRGPGGIGVSAASIRGQGHRHLGLPRQDDLAVVATAEGTRIVAAVADGVSAAPHAHVGATAATRYAVSWLLDQCADVPATEIAWHRLVAQASWQVVEAGVRVAEVGPDADRADREAAARAVATTLTAVVLDRQDDGALIGSAVTIGDSAVRLLSGDRFLSCTGRRDEEPEVFESSAVVPLPFFPADEVDPIQLTVETDEHLLLGSDGVWDALGGGGGPLGRALATTLRRPEPSLLEFAQVVDFVKDSFDDDRTLIAIWPEVGTDDRG